MIFGIFILLGSIYGLSKNTTKENLGRILQDTVSISDTENKKQYNNKLVSITGNIKNDKDINDIWLKSNNYLAIKRNVEIYIKKDTKSNKTAGTWEEASDQNKKLELIQRDLNISQKAILANNIKINNYSIDISKIKLPKYKDINIDKDNVNEAQGFKILSNKYLFQGEGSLEQPHQGDLRINYKAISLNQVFTIIGKLQENTKEITSFTKNNDAIYRIIPGKKSDAITYLQTEHKAVSIYTIIMLSITIWGSISMIMNPITSILKHIPIVGDLTKISIGLISLIITPIIVIITILISWIIYNPIILTLFIVSIIVITIIAIKTQCIKK